MYSGYVHPPSSTHVRGPSRLKAGPVTNSAATVLVTSRATVAFAATAWSSRPEAPRPKMAFNACTVSCQRLVLGAPEALTYSRPAVAYDTDQINLSPVFRPKSVAVLSTGQSPCGRIDGWSWGIVRGRCMCIFEFSGHGVQSVLDMVDRLAVGEGCVNIDEAETKWNCLEREVELSPRNNSPGVQMESAWHVRETTCWRHSDRGTLLESSDGVIL